MFPGRWDEYSNCGMEIENIKVICFKTPLHRNLFEYVHDDDDVVWTLDRLLSKHPSLGAIIDLSSSKHYNSKDVKRAGLLYTKLNVPGGIVPDNRFVQEFIKTMEEYTRRCPGMLIGVHCTHGVNRTGYLLCKYMQSKLNMSPDRALDIFESARGHRINRQHYIDNLLLDY
jgi:atypical dual specificity phosphatase